MTQRGLLIAMAILSLCACGKETEPVNVRPVRTLVIEKHVVGDPVVLTGQLRARDEVSLAFRLSGKLIERPVGVGDTVKRGQLVARLDSETEKNSANAAQADCIAAQAVLEQAESSEKRLNDLLKENAVSRTDYEGALRQLKTARAQVKAAQAKLRSADDQLGYTELRSEADGVITAKGAEPGEVVRVGQMILLLARQDGRDAIFDIPAKIIRDGVSGLQEVEVWLADSPNIKTIGHIREVSPQADSATRTYQVKIGLVEPASGMFLGSTVVGRLQLQADSFIELPSSALAMSGGNPAVWVIDPQNSSVHLRAIGIARYTESSVIVADGLQSGERVVIAGAQTLYEGQVIRLMDDRS